MVQTVFKNLSLKGEITDIITENGVITAIGKTPLGGIDCGGKAAHPGLVDIHTHGMGGVDTMDGDLTALATLYAQSGTTALLPTTMTVGLDAVKRVLSAKNESENGADLLGFHLEGPYLNPAFIGAQDPAHVRLPDYRELEGLENVKMVTVAPELAGAMDFIRLCPAVVALGHTAADYRVGMEAARAGAKCLTHTFNAMNPIHHRKPGLIGAALDADLYVQVICDGIHIHPAVIRMLYRMFGKERMVLISDSMRATGLPDGEYDLGGQLMHVQDGVARTRDGALAGSTSTLLDCVRHAVDFGIPLDDAVCMASTTPATLLGVKKGRIAVGYDCDLLLLDENCQLDKVVVKGKLVKG